MRNLFFHTILILLGLCEGSILLSQEDKFFCNGDLIITLSGDGTWTNAHAISLDGSMASFSSLANYDIAINSSGFNSVDGYIYGITNTYEIIKLKANGIFENLGKPSFLETNSISAAGDFDKNGIYWIHHRGTKSFYGIDVNNGNQLIDHLELQWHSSSGNTGKFEESIDDLVFDPLDPTSMYTYQRGWDETPINGDATIGHLLRADLDPTSDTYGYVFSAGKLDREVIAHLGAMFFDSQGHLFGYGDDVLDGSIIQNKLIKINRNPASASLVAIGPGASANDGCSCPFSMFITKKTPDSYNVCHGEPIEVTYEVGNNSTVDPNGAVFTDTFPPGFVIEDIIFEEEFGSIRAGTGIGTNKLIIDNIRLINKVVSFRIMVQPSLVSETYKIHAQLSNLPLRFGSIIYSDDPETLASNDPTIFVVDYLQFQEDFEIGDDITICEGDTASFIAPEPLPNTNILWNTGAVGNFASTTESGLVIATAQLGVCSDADTVIVTMTPYPQVELDNELTYDICDSLTVNINEISPGSHIEWSPAEIFQCQNCETNTAMTTTDQIIVVTATNEEGCSAHDTLKLYIEDKGLGHQSHIPNIFSPNGDRNNDFFEITPSCYRIEKFQIFDRWGNSVYVFEDNLHQEHLKWDGNNHLGSCTEGVYTWIGEFTYINSGLTKILSGDITIVR